MDVLWGMCGVCMGPCLAVAIVDACRGVCLLVLAREMIAFMLSRFHAFMKLHVSSAGAL